MDLNKIRDNIDQIKPLIKARKDICNIRNELNYIPEANKVIDQKLINGFNEALKQIEIKILFICGFIKINDDNFHEYENMLFDILESYRRVCYLDKIKEEE